MIQKFLNANYATQNKEQFRGENIIFEMLQKVLKYAEFIIVTVRLIYSYCFSW